MELTTARGNWGVWKRRWVWDFLKGFPKSSQKELGEEVRGGGWGRLGEPWRKPIGFPKRMFPTQRLQFE